MKKFKTNLSPIEYMKLSLKIQDFLHESVGDNTDYDSLHYIHGTMNYLLSNNFGNKDNQQGQIKFDFNKWMNSYSQLNQIERTHAKLEVLARVVNKISIKLDKPSETTKEQPLYDLEKWLGNTARRDSDDIILQGHDFVFTKNNEVRIQFYGFELILLPNGEYILNDTSGG